MHFHNITKKNSSLIKTYGAKQNKICTIKDKFHMSDITNHDKDAVNSYTNDYNAQMYH